MTITKEGSLTSFYTVNKAPIKHLRVYFSPKLSGSGDPSPSNVRPISGWNGLDVNYAQSIWNGAIEYGSINNDGQEVSSTTLSRSASYIPVELGSTLYVHYTKHPNNNYNIQIFLYKSDFTYNDRCIWVAPDTTITVKSDTCYIRLYLDKNYTNMYVNGDLAIFQVADISVIPVSWESLGTIYGGYVDLITGELIETNKKLILDGSSDENWWAYNTYDLYKGFALDNSGLKSGARQVGYANWLPVTSTATANNLECWLGVNNTRIYCASTASLVSTYSTSAWRAYLNENPLEIVIPLATPVTYQLTPTQLQTFIGQNNIWSNADRVEVEYDLAESNDELYRRRNIILLSVPHLESISGNIANFLTDLSAPIKDAKIYFEPILEGSGNPSPENIRNITGFNEMNIYKASKNLLNPAYYSFSNTYESNGITFTHDGNGIITMNGTSNGEKSAQVTFSWTLPFDCDYYFCGNTSFGSSVGDVYIWDLTTLARPTQWDGVTTSKSSNVGLQEVKLLAGHRIQFCIRVYYINTTTLVNATAKPILVHKTCTDRTFESYQGNTIPITFPAVGKNLLDITRTSKINPGASGSNITISNGVISIDAVASSARSYIMFSLTFPAGTYTISASYSGAVSCPKLLSTTEFNDSSYNTYYTAYTRSLNPQTNAYTFTLTTASLLGLVLPNLSNESGNPGSIYNILVENGSTATAYEPYNNTIYGGYIDLINGEIVLTHLKIMLTQSVDRVWNAWGTKLAYNATYMQSGTNELTHGKRKPGTVIYSNMLTPVGGTINPQQVTSLTELRYYGVNTRYPQYLFMANPNELSIADWRTWFTGTYANAYAIYELEAPIHHQLTQQQLKTLKGVNNIWSDANGPISIQYWTH